MPFVMNRNVFAGLAAGAAGTTALNTVTYLDMVVRARPASSTPEDTVQRVEEQTGVSLSSQGSGAEAAANRRSGLGALLGIAAGLGVGALYGVLRPRLRGLPLAVLGTGAGLAANVGTTAPMALLGVTNPPQWSAGSWVSDLVPHLAYGITTAAVWEQLSIRRRGK
jgi:hypothetical protein